VLQATGRKNFHAHGALDDPEHDRADECDRNIGGNNAEFADESHGKPPWFTSSPAVTPKPADPFPAEQVSIAVQSNSQSTQPR
jgi:hypothetical protein